MRWALLIVLLVHGLVHVLGPMKAFDLRDVPEVTQPISRGMGIVWLVAGLLHVVSAVLLFRGVTSFWLVALAAVILSQVAIVSAWDDARYGTALNVLVLLGVVWGFLSLGPGSFHAAHQAEARRLSAQLEQPAQPTETMPRRALPGEAGASEAPLDVGRGVAVLREEDLAHLPPAVARYLHVAGALWQPVPRGFHAEFRGRIRSGIDEPWMAFSAVQDTFLNPPTRLFHMTAEKGGIPVDVYHRLADGRATFQVKLASLVPMVRAAGPEMDQGETVTFLNDLCFLAPGSLATAPIDWETLGADRVRAHYTLGGQRVTADLVFDAQGRLIDFVSDDRFRSSPSGETFSAQRWSTPVLQNDPVPRGRTFLGGEALWHAPEGTFSYVQLELTKLDFF